MSPLVTAAFLIPSSKELPAWELEMLNTLLVSDSVVVSAFITSKAVQQKKENTSLKLFRKFENWWFRSMPDAFEKVPLPETYKEIKTVDESDHTNLSLLKVDIIYRSCLVTGPEHIKSYARYGLWHFIFGNGRYYNSNPTAFWEVMDDVPEIGSTLVVELPEEANEIPVYVGTTSTVPYSVKNTLNILGWKSSSFLISRINELAKVGAETFFSNATKKASSTISDEYSKRKGTPGNFEILGMFIRNGFRYFLNKFSSSLPEKKFTISFAWQSDDPGKIDFSKFKALHLPKGTFWADPFVIEKEGRTYVFFEEFIYQKRKAHISVLELKPNGTHSNPEIVLEKPYHLSYPYVFEFEGNVYMVPETTAQRTVELYKCTDFPLKWKFVKNLLEDSIVIDPTLIYHQNRWWLFGNGLNHPYVSTNDQLFLYYSDSLFSTEWKLHPQSPVATLLSNSRPAGKIFQRDGKLYRPAQNNSSRQYGYAIKINEIEILTESEYQEREVYEIVPGKGNNFAAIHTINFIDNCIVIDNIH